MLLANLARPGLVFGYPQTLASDKSVGRAQWLTKDLLILVTPGQQLLRNAGENRGLGWRNSVW